MKVDLTNLGRAVGFGQLDVVYEGRLQLGVLLGAHVGLQPHGVHGVAVRLE